MVSEIDYIKIILKYLQPDEKIRLFANGISKSPIGISLIAESVLGKIANIGAVGSVLLQPIFGDSYDTLLLVLTTKRLLIFATELDMMEFAILNSQILIGLTLDEILSIQEKRNLLTRTVHIISKKGTTGIIFRGKKQCDKSDKLINLLQQEINLSAKTDVSSKATKFPVENINQHPSIWKYSHSTVGEAKYIGSIKSDKFHNKNCLWVAKIAVDNGLCFSNGTVALDYGYEPCKVCNPCIRATQHSVHPTGGIRTAKRS